MAKELPYFKFNCSEWISGDITLEDLNTQGAFINICAFYWFKSGSVSLSEIKRRLKLKQPTINRLIDGKHIKVADDAIEISFLREQFNERGLISKRNSENGKKGGAPKGNLNAKNEEKNNPKQPKTSNKEREEEQEEEREENENPAQTFEEFGKKSECKMIVLSKYAGQKQKIIYDLRVFFKDTGQLMAIQQAGWSKFEEFMKANPGRAFESDNEVYHSFKKFNTQKDFKLKNTNSAAIIPANQKFTNKW